MDARRKAYEREKAVTDELRRSLPGRWPSVLAGILPQLRAAIDAGPRTHVWCPVHQASGPHHSGRAKDFRVRPDFAQSGGCYCTCSEGLSDGFRVIMWATGCSFKDARDEVIRYLGGDLSARNVRVTESIKEENPQQAAAKDAHVRQMIGKWWGEAVPLSDPRAIAGQTWLLNRGIPTECQPASGLRVHPKLGYYEQVNRKWQVVGEYPALLGLVRMPDGRTSTLHRTWLAPDGSAKAPVREARKQYLSPSTNPVRGAAIRFDLDESPVLSVAEGVETALSARAIGGYPTWSTLNSELLAQLVIPAYVKVVIVWADRDLSNGGQAAAVRLVDDLRAAGIRATGFMPPFRVPDGKRSVDWNDVLQTQGLEVSRNNLQVLALKRHVNQILAEIGAPPVASRRAEA